MKGTMNTQLGRIVIDTDVIATYAGSVAVECFGIVGMAAVSVKDGLVKLLKRESLTRGISVSFDDKNRLIIDFHVIVAYGVTISTVADNLVHNVKYKVEEYTGLKVGKINVYVEGVRIIDQYDSEVRRKFNVTTTSIDAGMVKEIFLAGAANLEAKKEWINDLNVFPVPDGDTGTNLSLIHI